MTLYEKNRFFSEILAFYQAPVPNTFHRTVCLHHLAKMDGSTHYYYAAFKPADGAWVEKGLCKQETNIGECKTGGYCF